MASRIQYQGDAAIHAAISMLLLRGYNSGRPIYDEADSDDLWIRGPEGNVLRCQARSAAVKKWKKVRVNKVWKETRWSKADNIQFPESVLADGVDLVAMCILSEERFFVGIFDADDIRILRKEGIGGNTNRKPKNGKLTHRPTIGFKWSIDLRGEKPKFLFANGRDVTCHFDQNGEKWNELFPLKWPKNPS
jgi:hypothetical protein